MSKTTVLYRAGKADSKYSDVGLHGKWCTNPEEAIRYGDLIVESGNWRSYEIEVRRFATVTKGATDVTADDANKRGYPWTV